MELVSLFCRIIATIVIELLIALLFGFRAKKQLLIIGAANIATQSLLNILLNIINFNLGSMAFVFNYVWMEILVFAVEAKIYTGYLPQYSQCSDGVKKSSAILYALTANAVSFAIGLLIARVIPRIF